MENDKYYHKYLKYKKKYIVLSQQLGGMNFFNRSKKTKTVKSKDPPNTINQKDQLSITTNNKLIKKMSILSYIDTSTQKSNEPIIFTKLPDKNNPEFVTIKTIAENKRYYLVFFNSNDTYSNKNKIFKNYLSQNSGNEIYIDDNTKIPITISDISTIINTNIITFHLSLDETEKYFRYSVANKLFEQTTEYVNNLNKSIFINPINKNNKNFIFNFTLDKIENNTENYENVNKLVNNIKRNINQTNTSISNKVTHTYKCKGAFINEDINNIIKSNNTTNNIAFLNNIIKLNDEINKYYLNTLLEKFNDSLDKINSHYIKLQTNKYINPIPHMDTIVCIELGRGFDCIHLFYHNKLIHNNTKNISATKLTQLNIDTQLTNIRTQIESLLLL